MIFDISQIHRVFGLYSETFESLFQSIQIVIAVMGQSLTYTAMGEKRWMMFHKDKGNTNTIIKELKAHRVLW